MKIQFPFLVFIFLFSVNSSNAQWQLSNGSPDAYPWSMVQKDTGILAGVFNGIYFTGDYGQTWTLKSCPFSYARALVVKDSVIFTTADYTGIFKSLDNGTTWTTSDSGITNPSQVWSLIQNDSLLILGTSGSFGGDTAAIYISADEGAVWTKVFSLGIYDVFYSYAISGNEVFAAAMPSGLFYSGDKGVTWALQNGTIPAKHIAMADTHLLCGTTGGTGGIYLSADKGITWVNVLPLYYANAFATSGVFTFAGTSNGFYYSLDHGYTWINDNAGLLPLTQVISICVADSFVFLGSTTGIYRRNIADIATGVTAISSQDAEIMVFPNPSPGIFKLNFPIECKKGTVEIYNAIGAGVYKENIDRNATATINLTTNSPGIYIIKITAGDKRYCGKIIIEND